ncbi:hypothetical protein U1Q18_021995 [Sarracenia purpurea var. burkii]
MAMVGVSKVLEVLFLSGIWDDGSDFGIFGGALSKASMEIPDFHSRPGGLGAGCGFLSSTRPQLLSWWVLMITVYEGSSCFPQGFFFRDIWGLANRVKEMDPFVPSSEAGTVTYDVEALKDIQVGDNGGEDVHAHHVFDVLPGEDPKEPRQDQFGSLVVAPKSRFGGFRC